MESEDKSIKGWWKNLSPKKKIWLIAIPIIIALAMWYSTTDAYKESEARRQAEEKERRMEDAAASERMWKAIGAGIGSVAERNARKAAKESIEDAKRELKENVNKLNESVNELKSLGL